METQYVRSLEQERVAQRSHNMEASSIAQMEVTIVNNRRSLAFETRR
jgi:hypothetical protein